MKSTTRSGVTVDVIVLLIATALCANSEDQHQPQQRWSQPVNPLDAAAIHDSYPFQISPPFETVIPPSYYPFKSSVKDGIQENQPSVDAIDDHAHYSHRDHDNGRLEEDSALHLQQIHQLEEPIPAPSGFEWPFAQPLPILRYWFRKADQDDSDSYGDDATYGYGDDINSTDSSTTDMGDSTTDDYYSTTDDATDETTTDMTDSGQDDQDSPSGDDDQQQAVNDVDEDEPPVNVPSGSFFMQCLIHLMCGVCIALGADVIMVGRKRRSASDEVQSSLLSLVARVHTAQIMIEGLNLGSHGRRGRCIQRAACREPGPALVYAETTDAIYRFAPDAVLRWLNTDRKTFKSMAHELRRGAKSGDKRKNCAKMFTCDEMDRKPEGFSLLTRLFDGPVQNTSNNTIVS